MPVTTVEQRRSQVLRLAAKQAMELPLHSTGFWFHSDVRDNYYFATHLFAYTAGGAEDWVEYRRIEGMELAAGMLQRILQLQDRDPSSRTYGHWPLHLGEDPSAAKPHPLPVELMGCLLILFYERYGQRLPPIIKKEVDEALLHLYRSPVYRHPLQNLTHHEAKHTAQKLLLGHLFQDASLLREGLSHTARILEHLERFGFKEYGCLPWHWHWIQAFTCVWELVQDEEAKNLTERMLEKLWKLRAKAYLAGAWTGARSRVWPHDAPKDTNTAHDYIQFGDFPAPASFPRLEGAALFTYEVSEAVRRSAAAAPQPQEIKRSIRFAEAGGHTESEAHTSLYRTDAYALGGIWERREEYDNEQVRWALSLPLGGEAAQAGVNQLTFFHPGAGYRPGDTRHASRYGEVLFHRGIVMELWDIPSGDTEAADFLIGCLPKGEWCFTPRSGSGVLDSGVYVSFHLLHGYRTAEEPDRVSVLSPLSDGRGGLVLEVLHAKEAAALGVRHADEWARYLEQQAAPLWASDGAGLLSVSYTAQDGSRLFLELANGQLKNRSLDSTSPDLQAYPLF
ncbi:hypothetical protein [Paenibacillus sp. KR2-11]|uniref:hypothetical protein n=1 Tax=Paenibacillus sp. KR2-11 TaxID=3385500 RepID=UPI0038FC127F